MKKFIAVAVVLTMLFGPLNVYADYAAPFSVQFEVGSSRMAGEEGTLAFSLPAEASYKYIAIDLGASGFMPVGAASLWIESWPNRSVIESNTTVNGNTVELLFSKVPSNAWSLNVSVSVRNPDIAQRVNASSITVKAGATRDSAAAIPSLGSFLDIDLKVISNVAKAIVGKQETVQFRVLEGQSIVNEPLRFTLRRNNKVLSSGVIPNGNLNLPLYFYYDPGKHSANYALEVSKVSQAQVKGTLTLPIVYDLTTSVPTEMVYGGEAAIAGRVKDGSGKGVAGVPVSIVNKGAPYLPVASANTSTDGSFNLKATFMDAAEHAVSITGTDYGVFDVLGMQLEVATLNSEVASNPLSTLMELRVFFEGKDVSQEAEIKIMGPDGKVLLDWSAGNPWGSGAQSAKMRKVDLGKLPLAGEYTILARYEDLDGGETTDMYDANGSTKFMVRTTMVVVTPTTLEEGLLAVGPNSIVVRAVDPLGAGLKTTPQGKDIARVRFTVSGAVALAHTFDSALQGAVFDKAPIGNVQKTVPLIVTQAGVVTVQGDVTLADGTVEIFSKEFTTIGWVVEASQILGIVGEEVLLRVVVRTPEGVPVNHAKVVWESNRMAFEVANAWGSYYPTSRLELDGLASNVQDGIYEIRAKLLHADDLVAVEVTRVRDNAARAYLVTRIAEGRVYSLKAEPASLIATLDNQRVSLSYENQQTRALNGEATLAVSGPGVDLEFVTSVDWHTPEFNVSPSAVGEIKVEGSSQDKSRFVPLIVPVRAPNVRHSLGTYATENMWQDLTLRGQDFSFGAALPVFVRISSEGAYIELSSLTGAYIERNGTGVSQTFTSYAATEHRFRFMPWVASSLEEGVTPLVRIEVSYNSKDWVVMHEAPVKPITITASPQVLYVGSTEALTVTIADANGMPYLGRQVEVRGIKSLTNTQGQASFKISPTGTHLVPITVTLDRMLPGNRAYLATLYVESKLLE